MPVTARPTPDRFSFFHFTAISLCKYLSFICVCTHCQPVRLIEWQRPIYPNQYLPFYQSIWAFVFICVHCSVIFTKWWVMEYRLPWRLSSHFDMSSTLCTYMHFLVWHYIFYVNEKRVWCILYTHIPWLVKKRTLFWKKWCHIWYERFVQQS